MKERMEQKLEEIGEFSLCLQDFGERLVTLGFEENIRRNRFSWRDYSCVLTGNALFYMGVCGEAVSGSLRDKIYK